MQTSKLAARTFFAAELTKLGEASARASDAYKHESKPVAIYALSQYLITLKKAEEIPENPFVTPKRFISFDMMLAHARLAKLYAETGQTDLGEKHVAEALQCARETGNCPTITNQTALAELVARIDRRATQ